MTKPTFELSIDTRVLVDFLAKADVGQTVTYTDLSRVLGSVVNGATPCLHSALRHLERSKDMVFGNVRGVGYQLLSDAQIVQTGEHESQRIMRHAKRAGKRLTKVKDFDGLSEADRVAHNARLSLFGAIAAISKGSSYKKLAAAVEAGGTKELPIGRTLEVFRSA